MMKKLVSLLVTVLILLIGMAPAVTVEFLPLPGTKHSPQGQAPAVSSFEAQGSDTVSSRLKRLTYSFTLSLT